MGVFKAHKITTLKPGKDWKLYDAWPKHVGIYNKASIDNSLSCKFDEKVYERRNCRGSIAQNALWSTGDHFIIIRPNVDRTGDDDVVLSASPSYVDSDEIQLVFNGLRIDDILHPRAYIQKPSVNRKKSKTTGSSRSSKTQKSLASFLSVTSAGASNRHLRAFRQRMGGN